MYDNVPRMPARPSALSAPSRWNTPASEECRSDAMAVPRGWSLGPHPACCDQPGISPQTDEPRRSGPRDSSPPVFVHGTPRNIASIRGGSRRGGGVSHWKSGTLSSARHISSGIDPWVVTTRWRIAESEGFRSGFSRVGENRAKRAFHSVLREPPALPIPIVPALSLVVPEKWSLFGHKMSGTSTWFR